jgi:hypothetical protein
LGVDLSEETARAIRRDLHNSSSSTLLIRLVVEVTDQYIALSQPSDASWNNSDSLGIDVAVARNSRDDGINCVERANKGINSGIARLKSKNPTHHESANKGDNGDGQQRNANLRPGRETHRMISLSQTLI